MIKLLFITLTGLVLVACGQKDLKRSRPTSIVLKKNSSKVPLFLTSQKKDCLADIQNEKKFELHVFKSGELLTQLYFVEIPLGKSPIIQEITYNYESEETNTKGAVKKSVIDKGLQVEVCPGERYSRNTVESAALNTSYFIEKTWKQVKDSAPYLDLPPVIVRVNPKIKIIQETQAKNYIERSEGFLTDNARYDSEEKSISFLPHSYEVIRNGFTMALWEIPMISSHEYGHHVFFSVLDDKKFQNDKDERRVEINHVISALSEGFADLVSFYTLDKEERSLKGVPCFQYSREIDYPNFSNFSEKTFSEEILKTFFKNAKDPAPVYCDTPDFQDPHTMGAIFAYNADSFLNFYSDSSKEKLSITLKWLERLAASHHELNDLKPKLFFRESMKMFIDVTLQHFQVEPKELVCKQISKFYPLLHKNYRSCH